MNLKLINIFNPSATVSLPKVLHEKLLQQISWTFNNFLTFDF
jgi:hypothetical protein